MNFAKMNTLQTETLVAMKAAIEKILDSRLDTELRVGRMVTFTNSDVLHTGRVTKINPKSVSLTLISPVAGGKWRVSRSALTVAPEVRESVKPIVLAVPHKPSSYPVDSW